VISAESNFVYGPPETLERYALYPDTVDVLAVQLSVTECATGWTPVPDREIAARELVALLVTVTVPGRLPAAAGVKVTFSVATCPGVTICPVLTPLAAYPAPEMLTPETVTFEFPALVKVTLRMLLLPRLTFAKFKLVVLALSMDVAAFTVRVAALLVMLPATLVTVTVNCAPLSEMVVAGVVYAEEVAPLTAVPFFFH
jgi:hypothetical protein